MGANMGFYSGGYLFFLVDPQTKTYKGEHHKSS
jgi:hypothetical protein